MKISMRGGDKWQKKYAKSLAKFSGRHMLTEKQYDEVEIELHLIKRLSENESIFGDTDHDTEGKKNPREFIIRIDADMKMRPMLETLAHEMVHVKQYAKGHMKDVGRNHIVFHKKKYSLYMNYWDQPWEIEAHGRERGLFEMWMEDDELNIDAHPWAFENLHTESRI